MAGKAWEGGCYGVPPLTQGGLCSCFHSLLLLFQLAEELLSV
jgi:hypothetical protein